MAIRAREIEMLGRLDYHAAAGQQATAWRISPRPCREMIITHFDGIDIGISRPQHTASFTGRAAPSISAKTGCSGAGLSGFADEGSPKLARGDKMPQSRDDATRVVAGRRCRSAHSEAFIVKGDIFII